jgi:hypothetical protein
MENPRIEKSKIDKSKFDVSQIFLVFMSLVGDVSKTAAALNLDPLIVQTLADEEGWTEKVRRISVMSKGGKPGDFERAQNRALNFVQAHRMRLIVDAMLQVFDGLTTEEVLAHMTMVDKTGSGHISARFMADLSSASEKVHALSYAALGDTVKERVEREEGDDGEMNTNAIHAAVIAALNAPQLGPSTAKLLEVEASNIARYPVIANHEQITHVTHDIERTGQDDTTQPPISK